MKPRHLLLPTLVALIGGGCATPAVPEKSIVVSEDQTEVIMPTGSHIRTRVLKGQHPITASPTGSISGEQANESLLTRDGTFPAVPIH